MIIIMLPASRELVVSIDYWRNALLALILFSIWVLFSRTFMIHRTVREGEGYLFNSSLPFPPVSQTLRH